MNRDPSVPDRERIDSDVRAFMRPASTPWIVFDRESRTDGELAFAAKAAMRAGVAFMSSPDLPPHVAHVAPPPVQPSVPTASSRLADINAMFPASVPQQMVDERRTGGFAARNGREANLSDEPSSLIVAADVVPTGRERVTPAPKKSGRLGLVSATLAAVGVCSTAAYIIASLQLAPAPEAPATAAAAAPPPPAAEPVVEPPVAPEPVAVVAPEVVGEKATDPKKRWGTLSIKGDATKKQVWFDGKRMLGKGDRSFMVYCGPHTVAVDVKTEVKDTEVPCNGELLIDK